MSFMLQIDMVQRTLTPEQGQEKLKVLAAAASSEPAAKLTGVIKLPEVNTFENPFPEWLVDALKERIPEIQFDNLNYIYWLECASEAEAKRLADWVCGDLKEWAARITDEMGAVMKQVQARVLLKDDTLVGYEGF